MITLEDINAAASRIRPYVRRTPLLAATGLAEPPTRAELFLKLECLQVSGSFKARGAMNKLLTTDPKHLAAGVVTASGGNHGLAVAAAARHAGIAATVFVPSTVTRAKIDKLRLLGATVKVVGTVWDEANAVAVDFAQKAGAAYFHPFADPAVVAGQGTIALEILAEQSDLDAVLIAIGGGGLIGGMSTALKALDPAIRIIAIEPEGSPTFRASLDAGHVVQLEQVTTSVATMACRETTDEVFALSRGAIEQVVLVSDDEMLASAKWLWSELGLAVDLSGAAAVAAMRTGRITFEAGQKVCALVCGAGPDAVLG